MNTEFPKFTPQDTGDGTKTNRKVFAKFAEGDMDEVPGLKNPPHAVKFCGIMDDIVEFLKEGKVVTVTEVTGAGDNASFKVTQADSGYEKIIGSRSAIKANVIRDKVNLWIKKLTPTSVGDGSGEEAGTKRFLQPGSLI